MIFIKITKYKKIKSKSPSDLYLQAFIYRKFCLPVNVHGDVVMAMSDDIVEKTGNQKTPLDSETGNEEIEAN